VPFAANGLSGGNGQFEIDGLPVGTYQICVEKRSAALLNPCVWADKQQTATVAAGKTVSGVAVVAQQGVTITVRVDDVKGLMASNPAKDDILIGVGHGKSPFIMAAVESRDGAGKTMSLVVPSAQAANISVFSGSFALGG
jgi:hypothetical protein